MNNQGLNKVTQHKHYAMGHAPYSFVGMWSQPSRALAEVNPTAYHSAMINRPSCCRFFCDHCGTSIQHHCIIRDAEGNLFCVGTSCIEKVGDDQLITEAKAANLKRQKETRRKKAKDKRQAQHNAYLAELEAQREKNGGFTDYEIEQQEREAKRKKVITEREEIAKPILDVLTGGGDFCSEVSRQIVSSGQMPCGRGQKIVIEIMAKQHGRKGSKAYKAQYGTCEALYREIASKLKTLDVVSAND